MPDRRRPRALSDFEIHRQPDDTTCGPTCLHAVYRHFGDDLPLPQLLAEVPTVHGGGTLSVHLATHALRRGYRVSLITWNLQALDPTWFALERDPFCAKLRERARARRGSKLAAVCRAYADYLEEGGELRLQDLEPALLRNLLEAQQPILTGLSATFLYREARERAEDGVQDDVDGDPTGHFVVLTGYRHPRREVLVSDPLYPNPLADVHTYPLHMRSVIGAIYLGVLTHDANLLVISPPEAPLQEGRARTP